ncbi:MAG: glycosyltransferase family 39 protein [Pseudomonadota bacterium]
MARSVAEDRLAWAVLLALGAIAAVRIAAIFATPLQLGADEAQYWRWGQDWAWGYYSKPPLIAWVIGATTSLFGDAEWAIRLPAPLLHAVAAASLFALAREMYDARVGALAALGYMLMPGVTLSSGVMSTDGLLLPLWSLSLLALWRLRGGGGLTAAVSLGAALGLGGLAKYAMVYFILGALLAAMIDKPTRSALMSWRGAAAAGVAAAILAPHVAWSWSNDFETLAHTADNANWGGSLFHPENALRFFNDQMGVFGPIAFLALFGAVTAFVVGVAKSAVQERWLLCFILPAVGIVLIQAIISRAHANWAAVAYPAASILVPAWLLRIGGSRRDWALIAGAVFAAAFLVPMTSLFVKSLTAAGLATAIMACGALFAWRASALIWASLALHVAIAAAFTTLAVGPVSWSEYVGRANDFKRVRGWPETVQAIAARANSEGVAAIVVDERENWHGLDFYGRDALPMPIYAWRRGEAAKSHAERENIPASDRELLMIAAAKPEFRDMMRNDFDRFDAVGTIDVPLGGGQTRRFELFIASGFDPKPRTPAWEARFEVAP